jgi:hypothetical protein
VLALLSPNQSANWQHFKINRRANQNRKKPGAPAYQYYAFYCAGTSAARAKLLSNYGKKVYPLIQPAEAAVITFDSFLSVILEFSSFCFSLFHET